MTDGELEKRLAKLSPAQRKLLERRLSERRGDAGPTRLPDGDGPFPLSFAQERFWFLEQLEPGNPAHHLPGRARLTGPLDLDAYRRAWEYLLERHESLRTVFRPGADGEPRQHVLPHIELPLETLDLRGLPPGERENQRLRSVERAALDPFDLERGPLLRLRVLRLGDELHEVVSCLHHIVADGLSIQHLGAEIEAVYGALVAGRRPELPPLSIRVRDHAVWQRRHLRGPRLEPGLDHWRRHLADAPALELPTDRPRGREWRALARREGLDLSPTCARALRSFARERGATLYMVLLAGYVAALSRWCDTTDVTVGTLVSGRDRAELDGLVGLFVNTLALRVDAGGDPDFDELLRRVKRVGLSAQDHQEIPFERVVDALQPERRLDRNPLFQVLFNFIDFQGYQRDLGGGLRMEYELAQAGTVFDLTLYATVAGDDLRIELEYEASLWCAATIRRLLGHLELLLFRAPREPHTPVADLRLLPPAELRRLARFETGPPRRPDGPRGTLHGCVSAQARRRPDQVAVEVGGRTLTYAELEARADGVARALVARGVRPGDRVGIALDRSLDLIPTLLGVHRAGAAYVPLDPDYPEDRLAFIREDADLVLLLDHAPEDPGGPAVPAADDGDALAYVIYTSGSTGRPKGVCVRHRSLVHLLDAMARTPGLDAGDRVLALTTLSFDIAAFELFGPLIVGGTVRIAGREDAADGRRLSELVDREEVSVVQATPATWRMLLLAGWRGRRGLRILCGGEPLPQDLAQELLAAGDEVWNLYGPTETTVWSTADRVDPGPVTLGRPLQDTWLRVVDRRGERVPIGVAGELWIGGRGVAEGYHERPELTRERFREESAGRVYRTGDRVRWRTDGRLEFLGREDDQVKLRGHRLELGEIETTLRALEGVREAAAGVVEPKAGDQRLVAWVVLEKAATERGLGGSSSAAPGGWGLGMGEGKLRQALRQRLPSWMIPSTLVPLAELPRTPNGKLDRRALPLPQGPDPAATPPLKSEIEQALAPLWCEVLGVPAVGPDDDFFALGGHSLLATQLATRVRSRFGVHLSLRDFFGAPRLAAVAELVEQQTGRGIDRDPIESSPSVATAPLSQAQERIWFLEQLGGAGAAYHMAGALELEGPLDSAALERALDLLVARHGSLRTVFRRDGGAAVQEVLADPGFRLDHLDLGQEASDADLRSVLVDLAKSPFDLEHGPLMRATLVRRSTKRHVLMVVQHHLVSDAWSIGVLMRELTALYGSCVADTAPALEPLAVSYGDFARWQRGRLQGEVLERLLAEWRQALSGAPAVLNLPTDRPRPAVQTHRGLRRGFLLGAKRARRLRDLAQREETTLFSLLMAAFQAFLGRLAGQDDVVVGTTVAGRDRVEIENLVGFFANTLPLRARLDPETTFRAHLGNVHGTVLRALDAGEVPFGRLTQELQPVRDLSRQPIFQASFDLLNTPPAPHELAGLRVRPLAVDTESAKFDLSLQVTDDEELTSVLELNADLFDAATAERWWGHLEVWFDDLLDAPDKPLGQLRLCSEAERERWLDLGRGTRAPLPQERVDEAVARVAAADPERIAVVAEEARWTFGQLERFANGVAQALLQAGVRPGDVVGVCLGRRPEWIAVLLGVWKAGAAWLALDPAYPAARLGWLLEDGDAHLVVADRDAAAVLGDRATLWVDELVESDTPAARRAGYGDQELAYVLYTSGSSGRPKGVEVPHRAIAHYATWAAEHYRAAAGAGSPVHTSPGFDLTLTGLFTPLLSGTAVELVPAGEGVEALARSAEDSPGQSLVKLTPSHLEALSHRLTPEVARAWTRALVVGGEALDGDALAFWRDHAPQTRIFNEYGPTEATVGCTVHRVDDAPADGQVPIGRPLPNTSVYVLDGNLEPVPVGVAGELWISGVGVALGYRGRPTETEERFRVDPFADDTHQRMYRSGDLARWRSDGALEYLGRVDDQLKVRGVRVEPAEVEAVLRRAPGVADAAVVLSSGRLVAYVVAERAVAAGLRARAARELPEALVPATVVALETLPLGPHGKLDRDALPAPERELLAEAGTFHAPASDVEAALAALWSEVLGLDRVGRDDDFFALGGDSILSLEIVSRAAELGLHLRTRDVFQHPTVAGLAWVATQAPAGEPVQPLVGEVPLLPAQRWLLERGLAEFGHWNQAVAFELGPAADPDRLEPALRALEAHHDALRLSFRRGAEGWIQHCAAPGHGHPTRVTRVDLGAMPEDGFADCIRDRAAAAQAELDPEQGRVSRMLVFTAGSDRPARLVWILHHLVVDAVSWRILAEDLGRWLVAERPPELPARSASLADCAAAVPPAPPPSQRERLPRDRRGGSGLEGSVFHVSQTFDEETTAAVLAGLPAYRARSEDLLLCALGAALGAWTESESVRVDVEGHGRVLLEPTRTVGWFTRMLPVDLAGPAGTPGERLKRAKEERARVEKLVGVAPAADVLFNFLGRVDAGWTPGAPLRPLDLDLGPAKGPNNARDHALEIDARVEGGRLRLDWAASAELHKEETVRALGAALERELGVLLEHGLGPGVGAATPSDFPLARLDGSTLDRLVAEEPGIEDLLPLTPTQQGMFFHSLVEPSTQAYDEELTNVLEGDLDVAALRGAFELLVQRHALLRSRVAWKGLTEPLLVVRASIELPWRELDWGPLARDVERERLATLGDEGRERGFDLERGPLLDLTLIRLGPGRHAVSLRYHHLILDGWSMPLVLQEVLEAYGALRRGTLPQLPAPAPLGASTWPGWVTATSRRRGTFGPVAWRAWNGSRRWAVRRRRRPGRAASTSASASCRAN